MTFTLLFDLDNTLLLNDMGTFLPAYFQSLSTDLAPTIIEGEFLPAFLTASQKMFQNQRPDKTLETIFYEELKRNVKLDEALFPRAVDNYYKSYYPDLKEITETIEDVGPLLTECARRKIRLAVTTNPFFPAVAVEERLRWAKIPFELTEFEIITSFEKFHFGKPNPAFFAEVMANLGWPEGPVVVIGDDPRNDIQGASELGLASYFVGSQLENATIDGSHLIRGQGDISNLLSWLEAHPEEKLHPNYHAPKAIIAIFKSTAAVIHTYMTEVGELQWTYRTAEAWSGLEILHHLIEVEQKVNLARVNRILSESDPFIQGVDTDAWHADGFGVLLPLDQAYSNFLNFRLNLIQVLEGLDEKTWDLPARHAIFGPTSLKELMYIAATHDQMHIRQLREMIF